MNGTKSAGLRMPVQSAVNRAPTHAALTADGGIEAQWGLSDILDVAKQVGNAVQQVAPYVAPVLTALA